MSWLLKSLDANGDGIGGAVQSGMRSANMSVDDLVLLAKLETNFQSKVYPCCGLWAGIDGTSVDLYLHE